MRELWLRLRWWLKGKPCYCGFDKRGHGRVWETRPWWCSGVRINVMQHAVADAFWHKYKECEDKHGYYESTWAAINAAFQAAMKEEPDAE
jgi:hypothetical protein